MIPHLQFSDGESYFGNLHPKPSVRVLVGARAGYDYSEAIVVIGDYRRLFTLQKLVSRSIMLLMEANPYRFLGLEADREACNCLRKSRLMLASSFLVGTRFSCCRFSFSSIAYGHPKAKLLLTGGNGLIPLPIAAEPRVHFRIVCGATGTARRSAHFVVASIENNTRLTDRADNFNDSHFFCIQNQFVFTHDGELLRP